MKKICFKNVLIFLLLALFLVNIVKAADVAAPVVTAFVVPADSNSLTVSITTLTATDDTAVTGFFVSESSVAPDQSDGAWIPVQPSTYTFATQGQKTLYAWAKDAAGNVSLSLSASVDVDTSASDTIAPAAPTGLGVL